MAALARSFPSTLQVSVPRNRRRVRSANVLAARLAFGAVLIGFAFALQFSTANLGSVDGYFHIRYSALLRAAGWRGFPPEFPWLPLTILAPDRYYDHHLLFHVWLSLFAGRDLILGAKLASACGAAAAFLAAYGFLLLWRIRRAEWWMIALLAGAAGFPYRMEMPRVQAWSLVFLIAALHLLLRRRDPWLFPLAWLYTWTYDAFPLLLALCACSVVARALLERTIAWRPVAWAVAGIVGGLVVNPYFPADLRYIAHHYLAKIQMSEAVRVGSEWYPLPVAEWLGWSGLLALLAAVGVAAYRYRAGLTTERLTTLLAAAFFFCLLWRAVRFVEYFVPFAAFALAFTLHERIDALVARLSERGRRVLAGLLLAWLAGTTVVAIVQLRGRPPASRYGAAARWIDQHVEPGSMVFLTDWSDFPLLFFHAPNYRYVIGLDPTYLAERDPALYEQWRRIVEGREPNSAALIDTAFGARIALTNTASGEFLAAMDREGRAQRVYEDADCILYRIP